MVARLFITAACGLLLAGCGLPTSGPKGNDILLGQKDRADRDKYCFIKINPDRVAVANKYHYRLAGAFKDRRPPVDVRFGVGDSVGVTIFESASGGLFFSSNGGERGNFVTLPAQNVDERGYIFVPYAGRIRASGRTVSAIQQQIVARLKNKALNPQAIVTLTAQRDAQITVIGSVGQSSRFPVSASGERILDAIARAGGISSPGFESWVLLERRGRIAVAPFGALVHEPRNNIYVRPQDTLYVFREPQTYVIFGATGQQNHIPFGSWRLSLAEAIAKAGGLNQTLADPAWVFAYRFESIKLIDEMDSGCKVPAGKKRIPVIYQINLRDPSGYFLARKMMMRNKDVVYVSNSKTVEFEKFLTHFRSINSAIQDPISTAISGYALKAAAQGTGSAVVIQSAGGVATP